MGLFSGIENAKVYQSSVFLQEGAYKLKIEACKEGEQRNKEKFFVVDFMILDSTNDERPADSTASWITMQRYDGFLGYVKGFVMAAMGEGITEDDITEEELEVIVDAQKQPLVGRVLKAQASKINLASGKPFTKVAFFPAD